MQFHVHNHVHKEGKVNRFSIVVLAAGLLLGTGAMSRAQGPSDVLFVKDATGAVVSIARADEATEDPSAIVCVRPDIAVDVTQFGNATTLVESDGTFSDIFGVA